MVIINKKVDKIQWKSFALNIATSRIELEKNTVITDWEVEKNLIIFFFSMDLNRKNE